MKSLGNSVSIQQQQTNSRFADLLASLASGYARSLMQAPGLQPSFFAHSIVRTLLLFPDLLNLLNQVYLQDLKDSIETHIDKYLNQLLQTEEYVKSADDFKNSVKQLADFLTTKRSEQSDKLLNHNSDLIKDLMASTLQKCRILFAEQAHNQEAIDKLLAASIAFNLENLSLHAQTQLVDKLLICKELWQIEQNSHNNFLIEFYNNQLSAIKQLNILDAEDAASMVNEYFLSNQILQSLSDEKLISLYDRTKNLDTQASYINSLLQKVHIEAQFRYSYNRLSDSGYELLKRFQSFDAIAHQIENSEFILAETFLLRNNNLNHEILMLIARHADNIKAVGSAKSSSLTHLLNHISANIDHHKIHDKNHDNISSIKAKLSSSLDPQVLKRYVELDKFTVNCLKNKYLSLYDNIKNITYNEVDHKAYLNQIIIRRLAQDYHITNLSNSMNKLRAMSLERVQLMQDLSAVDFVSLFDAEHLNNFITLNFRKQIIGINVKNSTEYLNAIIKIITKNCSASQLEALYKPLLHKELSSVEAKLKQEIHNEIKERTSLSKMIYSLFRGKSTEYNKLKVIKNNYETIEAQRQNSKQDQQQSDTADVKLEMHNDLGLSYEQEINKTAKKSHKEEEDV